MASSSSVHIEDARWSPTETLQMGVLHVSQALIYRCGLPCLWGLKLGPTNGHCGAQTKSSGYSGGPGEVPFLHCHFKNPGEVQSCHSRWGPTWSLWSLKKGFPLVGQRAHAGFLQALSLVIR